MSKKLTFQEIILTSANNFGMTKVGVYAGL